MGRNDRQPAAGTADEPTSEHDRAGQGPAHWEIDAVLMDGSSIHIRPIHPSDAPSLAAFHSTLSLETVRRRFFSPKRELGAEELQRFTTVDHHDRVALVAELGDELVGVARYDRLGDAPDAEVAFVVADAHQGRGVGTVLLDQLASAARERGITRFVAETLADNRPMLAVFRGAGFEERTRFDAGTIDVELIIEPTDRRLATQETHEHRAESASVARLLRPSSVAVIGASRNRATVGHQVLRNLLAAGFDGPVYPVNPSAEHVASVKAYPSVLDVPGPVDLAVITVPAAAVADTILACARKGVAGLVVLSAGFAEIGGDGIAEQDRLRDLARRNGMRLVGPNCIGVANTALGLNATFSPYAPARGRIAMQSQSGALGIAILERSRRSRLGVSSFVSVGNKADVSGNDLLQYWEDDPGTDVILLYLESFGNPRKFSRIARRVSRRKPIVAVKSGRSAAGERAASSHTAAMASPDVAVDALFRQAGVIRVDSLDDMVDVAQLLVAQPLPQGPRVAIVGNSGGPGILATDACAGTGLDILELPERTQLALRTVVDANASVTNPVDLIASATPEVYGEAIRIVAEADTVDAILVICTPTFAATPPDITAMLTELAPDIAKPIVACFLAWPDLAALKPTGSGSITIPLYGSPEPAARALAAAAGYAHWRQRPPGAVPDLDGFDVDRARAAIEGHLRRAPDQPWLPPELVNEVLLAIGLPYLATASAATADEAAANAARLGFPVVLKAAGAAIVHKSDVGGVELDLQDEAAVREAFDRMRAAIGAAMTGGVLQSMAGPGIETIIGVTVDPLFGPLVMFGLGGVATELLQDRSFRILPLTDVDAAELVRSLKSSPLLFGYRGREPVAVDQLEDALQRVARLAELVPEIVELDLNPVIAAPEGVAIVDARIRVERPPPES
jgi:acetyl coenzyme A synthetase (ADP forming)-like protein